MLPCLGSILASILASRLASRIEARSSTIIQGRCPWIFNGYAYRAGPINSDRHGALMHLTSSILDAPSFGARFFDAAPNSSVGLHLASMRPCLASIFLASTVRASTLASMLAFYWMLLASSILDAPRFGARFFDASTPRFDASMPQFDTCFDPGFEARFDNRSKLRCSLLRYCTQLFGVSTPRVDAPMPRFDSARFDSARFDTGFDARFLLDAPRFFDP